jgi:glycosyltransferase involved in cell wall biosynthesis
MKMVVVSHACITPRNQEFFQRVCDVSGWSLTIILPSRWANVFANEYAVARSASFAGRLLPTKVFLKGNIPLHFYHFRLFKALRDENPDIIYVHNESYAISTFQAVFYNAVFGRRVIGFSAFQNINKRYVWPIRVVEKFTLSHADFCFAGSDSAARTIREKGFKSHVAVLPLGVGENHISGALPGYDMDDAAGKAAVIGYVGRLVPEKGVAVLLRSLAILQQTAWECHIIGDGPEKDHLKYLSLELGISKKVKFFGYIGHGEIAQYMRKFSVLILPSLTRPNWAEQFGRVIIEALAAEVPVIGSTCGEIPVLLKKLEGGLIVNEDDPDDLAGAIDNLLADPKLRRRLAMTGNQRVRELFSESKIAADFVRELNLVDRIHQAQPAFQ